MLESLVKVQNELKAPKNLRNTFGNYNYRNAESILEAVKPLLSKYGLQQTISDHIELIGDRYYVVAEVTVADGKDSVTVKGYARESEEKKGMDSSQVTGTASSYARKYALNGMYAIDDTKDADTDEYHKQTAGAAETSSKKYASDEAKNKIREICKANDWNMEQILLAGGWKKGTKLTEDQYEQVLLVIKNRLDARGE